MSFTLFTFGPPADRCLPSVAISCLYLEQPRKCVWVVLTMTLNHAYGCSPYLRPSLWKWLTGCPNQSEEVYQLLELFVHQCLITEFSDSCVSYSYLISNLRIVFLKLEEESICTHIARLWHIISFDGSICIDVMLSGAPNSGGRASSVKNMHKASDFPRMWRMMLTDCLEWGFWPPVLFLLACEIWISFG